MKFISQEEIICFNKNGVYSGIITGCIPPHDYEVYGRYKALFECVKFCNYPNKIVSNSTVLKVISFYNSSYCKYNVHTPTYNILNVSTNYNNKHIPECFICKNKKEAYSYLNIFLTVFYDQLYAKDDADKYNCIEIHDSILNGFFK